MFRFGINLWSKFIDILTGQTVIDYNLDSLKNERHCDIAFIVGESRERILCHKHPIMAQSPVFQTMFADRWKSEQEQEVEEIVIPDVEPAVFREFLQFIYGDIFSATKMEEALKLLYVAAKYQVTALIEKCEMLVVSEMQLEDAVEMSQIAQVCNLNGLKKQAELFMARQFTTLIDHPSFERMDERTLLNLLPLDELFVNEFTLFDALLRWSSIQLGEETPAPVHQRRVLQKILPRVRFPAMSAQTFKTKVLSKNILTAKESNAILTYINSKFSAKKVLRAKLTFPWKPRCSSEKQHSLSFYGAKKTPVRLQCGDFGKVTNQVDALLISISWAQGIDSNCLNKTGSITSVVLRGPNYFSLSDYPRSSWPIRWIVSVKIAKNSNDFADGFTTLENERTIDGIKLFVNRQTSVAIDPPLVLELGCIYQISVSYSNPIYLPRPNPIKFETSVCDYLTSTCLKTCNCVPKTIPNNYYVPSLASFDVRVAASSNEFVHNSHCIRAVKMLVCDS